MPVDEKYGARKSACSGESAVSLDKCVEDRGFHGVTPSGRVRRKGPDNEACWSLTLNLTTKTINIRMAKTGVVNVSCNNYMEQSQRQCPTKNKKQNC